MEPIQVDFDRKVYEAANPGAEDAELDVLISEVSRDPQGPQIGDPTVPPAAVPEDPRPNWTLDDRARES